MKCSDARILTTHVGSLPRSAKLSQLLIEQEQGNLKRDDHLHQEIEKAMGSVIAKQLAAGIDIGNDGEQYRVGFQTYIPQRMEGFSGESNRRPRGENDKGMAQWCQLVHSTHDHFQY